MTTSPFRFSFSQQPRRTTRSATAPAKSVRFAVFPPSEKQCQVSKEPSNPDLSSLGPVITKIHKQVQSESAKTAQEEVTKGGKFEDAPKALETSAAKSKSSPGKSVERPKTAPINQSSAKFEVKNEEIQNPAKSTLSGEVPAGPISSLKLTTVLKSPSALPKDTKSKAKSLGFKIDNADTKRGTIGSKPTATMGTAQIIHHANQVRERTNSTTHMHTRMMRHDVSVLRSKMIKVEEEFRLASKSRSLLESGLQEVRKSMSVNHQAISAHQRRKKSSEEPVLKVLAEESKILSSSKQLMEQHLLTIKTNMHNLDKVRREVESKMSVLGRALVLDSQNFKVFNGPLSTKGLLISRQRHYSTSSKPPHNAPPMDPEIVQFLSHVSEVVKVSKKCRGDLLSVLVSMKSTRSSIHSKVTDAMASAEKEATRHRQNYEIQRGKVKLEKHSTSRHKHVEEIALGLSLGPHSEAYRETSDKIDRPLSRLRPEAMPEERASLAGTTKTCSRQLTVTMERDGKLTHSDQKLKKKIREKSSRAGSLSKSLRLRKASLDHKWVQS